MINIQSFQKNSSDYELALLDLSAVDSSDLTF